MSFKIVHDLSCHPTDSRFLGEDLRENSFTYCISTFAAMSTATKLGAANLQPGQCTAMVHKGESRVVVQAFFPRQRQRTRQNFRRKSRVKAATAKTEARQDRDRGRDVKTEARQSGAEARPRSRQDEPRHLKPIIVITTLLLPCKNFLCISHTWVIAPIQQYKRT